MTVTELSKALNLSKSTVHEHLFKLTKSGLVIKSKRNLPHKWVYYELSKNGRSVLVRSDIKRMVLHLSSTTVAFVVGIYELANYAIGGTIVGKIPAGGGGGLEPPTVVIHEPIHLFIGLILIGVGTLLIWRLGRKGLGIKNAIGLR